MSVGGPVYRVLVVDDHEDSRELLESALLGAGFVVDGVRDAETALERLRDSTPEAIITDLSLTAMTGEELAVYVRSRPELSSTCLVVTSGREADPRVRKLFDAVHPKPVDFDAVARDLLRLLRGRSVRPAAAAGDERTAGSPVATQPALDRDAMPPTTRAGRENDARGLAPSRQALPAEQYRLLVENAPTMVWRSGVDGKCDWFNETWLAFTGRTFEQEYGDGWAEGVHPADSQPCIDYYLANFAKRQPYEMEYRLRRFDGTYRWVFDRGVPVHDERGDFAGFIGSCVDVHDRRGSDEAKSRFLTTMAHEMRTPLTPMAAYVHQLKGMAARGETVTDDLVGKLARQMGRLVRLVDDLSDAGRIDAGSTMHLERHAVDVKLVVTLVVDEQRDALARTPTQPAKPTLTLELPPGPALVMGDARRITQAVRQILSNAVKYSPDGGPILVKLGVTSSAVSIAIADEGIGIPEPEVARVGTNFFRASNASVTNYPGVGMGLATTAKVIAGHGGTFEVRSRAPGGTTVTVTIPRGSGDKT